MESRHLLWKIQKRQVQRTHAHTHNQVCNPSKKTHAQVFITQLPKSLDTTKPRSALPSKKFDFADLHNSKVVESAIFPGLQDTGRLLPNNVHPGAVISTIFNLWDVSVRFSLYSYCTSTRHGCDGANSFCLSVPNPFSWMHSGSSGTASLVPMMKIKKDFGNVFLKNTFNCFLDARCSTRTNFSRCVLAALTSRRIPT